MKKMTTKAMHLNLLDFDTSPMRAFRIGWLYNKVGSRSCYSIRRLASYESFLLSAIVTRLFFELFTRISDGATYSVVPFLNTKTIGFVSAIVGAGGVVSALITGFLSASTHISYRQSFFIVGIAVVVVSVVCSSLTIVKFEGLTASETPEFTEPILVLQKFIVSP